MARAALKPGPAERHPRRRGDGRLKVRRRRGRPGAVRPLVRSALAALALAVTLGLLWSAPAAAHAFLVRTTPRANERLTTGPPAISLQFSEPIVGGEQLTLRTDAGRTVPVGPLERLPGGTGFQVPVPPLDEAIYVASWQVLGRDGEVASGEFAFAVGSGGRLPTAMGAGAAAVAWPNVVASWLFLGGLALALGGLASEAAVWGPVARRHGLPAFHQEARDGLRSGRHRPLAGSTGPPGAVPPLLNRPDTADDAVLAGSTGQPGAVPRAPVLPSLLVSLAGATLSFLLIAGARVGGGLEAGLDPNGWGPTLGTRPGLLALAGALLVADALWIALCQRLRSWALLPLGGAVAAAAWRGHSGISTDAGLWWAAPANALHLAGAGLWVGALVHLALVLRRLGPRGVAPVQAEAARRYASLALVVVPPFLAAGALTALAELTAPAELISTPYGRTLLLKLLFVTAALALAVVARRRALPANPGRTLRLRRLITAEILILLAAMSLSAVLVNAATPRAAVAEADLLGAPSLDGPVVRVAALAGSFAVHLAATEDQLELRVIPPSERFAPGTRIQLEGQGPTGAPLGLYPRACGPGCLAMSFAWPTGTTRFTATVSAPDWPGGSAELELPWPPGPEATALLNRVVETMRAQPEVRFTERVSSGPGMASGPYPITLAGASFIERELYVASGADDVRLLPGDAEPRSLVLFLPSSWMWYQLWFDANYRLQREVIVNPGHLIERTFSDTAPARP